MKKIMIFFVLVAMALIMGVVSADAAWEYYTEVDCSNAGFLWLHDYCTTCIDSDGGNEPTIQGYTYDNNINLTDECVASTYLKEGICYQDEPMHTNVSCLDLGASYSCIELLGPDVCGECETDSDCSGGRSCVDYTCVLDGKAAVVNNDLGQGDDDEPTTGFGKKKRFSGFMRSAEFTGEDGLSYWWLVGGIAILVALIGGTYWYIKR